MEVIVSLPNMILDEDFMMFIHDEFMNDVPPFKDFLSCRLQLGESTLSVKGASTPLCETNIDSTSIVHDLGSIAANAILTN